MIMYYCFITVLFIYFLFLLIFITIITVAVVVVATVVKPLGSGKVRLVQYRPFSLLAMALASA